MKVYLAGSTAASEIERVERWRKALVEAGIEVVSTWIDVVTKVRDGNPRDVWRSQRSEWALNDLQELDSAEVLWFLVPPIDKATRGGWFELGYAYARANEEDAMEIVVSGDTKQSIFCALVIEGTDEEAFDYLVEYAK